MSIFALKNYRWGLLLLLCRFMTRILCFSMVGFFFFPTGCCLFITSFSCDIEQVFDKKLREGVSSVSLDANKTHSLFLFYFQRITWDSMDRDRELCIVKGKSEVRTYFNLMMHGEKLAEIMSLENQLKQPDFSKWQFEMHL